MKMSKFLLLMVILPCFVQSLSVNRISDALNFNNIFVNDHEFGFTPAPPPHTEEAKLARYVVHYSGNLVENLVKNLFVTSKNETTNSQI